ncbi:hypothetical protein Cni_G02792 [Canna indica]|uniref:Uncharacterized protein n=1 Tax=Canna indica TaxID=4628 RepID=A0AAQ3Q2H5_9LILI|nr:hypothetical protein Cni_G02792 [Canna indica]
MVVLRMADVSDLVSHVQLGIPSSTSLIGSASSPASSTCSSDSGVWHVTAPSTSSLPAPAAPFSLALSRLVAPPVAL